MTKSGIEGNLVIKRSWVWLTVAALVAGMGALVYSVFVYGTFLATGILLFDGDVAAYRILSTDSYNVQRLESWIAANRTTQNSSSYDRLRSVLNSPSAFDAHFQPFLRVTKTDIRDLVSFKDEALNQIEGIAISFRSSSATEAPLLVLTAARYLRDASLRDAIFLWLQTESNKASLEIPRWDEMIRNKTFQVEQLNKKLAGLNKIAATYSEKGRTGQRDILSFTDATAKFLPIAVQQLGVESELVEVQRELRNASRELSINRFVLHFSASGLSAVANKETGAASFEAIREQLQKEPVELLGSEAQANVADARGRIRLHLENFRQRFIVKPLLARESPQVTDRTFQALQTGILVAIATWLLLFSAALLPRFIRWVLAPERQKVVAA